MNTAEDGWFHAMRRIGPDPVGAVALGCASLTFDHASDPARAAEVINAALDAGIGVLDTAAAYTVPGATRHNETLISTVGTTRRGDLRLGDGAESQV